MKVIRYEHGNTMNYNTTCIIIHCITMFKSNSLVMNGHNIFIMGRSASGLIEELYEHMYRK